MFNRIGYRRRVRELQATWLLWREARVSGELPLAYWDEWWWDYTRIKRMVELRFGDREVQL